MPCEGPSDAECRKEQHRQKLAMMTVYAQKAAGKKISPEVQKVADNPWGNYSPNIDDLTITLCALINSMSEGLREEVVYNPKSRISRDLANWWESHQEQDRQREEDEETNKKLQELREKALSKLSAKDRKVLNLPSPASQEASDEEETEQEAEENSAESDMGGDDEA